MRNTLNLFLILILTWWLLSGYTINLLLGLGFISVILVVWISKRMDKVDDDTHPISNVFVMFHYFPWLFIEIIKANFDVAIAIISKEKKWDPKLVEIKAGQTSEVGRVIFANSITLTPGTVTIGVEENTFTIHSLTKLGRDGLESGEMDKRVTALNISEC